jgi:crotonobetaine/carnitine-CoA ligase
MSGAARPKQTIAALFSDAVAQCPTNTLLVENNKTFTYAETYDSAQRSAAGLLALGVQWQEPVLLMLDNSADYCITFLGMHLTGLIEVPVNTAYKGSILAHVIRNSGAQVMIVERRFLPRLRAIAGELTDLRLLIVRDEGDADDAASVDDLPWAWREFVDLQAEALPQGRVVEPWHELGILYTSGTTGPSKGVRVTQAHAWACYQPSMWSNQPHVETVLVTQPLFHLGGQWAGVTYAMHSRGTAVIEDRFHATTYWDTVRRHGCSQSLILGAMANFLYRQAPRPDDADNSLERVIMIPTIPEMDAFADRFGVQVGSAYGLTEGSTCVVAPYGAARPGECGRVRHGFEVRLVDDHDQEVPTGRPGQAVIRTTEPWWTTLGYNKMAEVSLEVSRNLWLHTGDVLVKDAAGTFRFVDRQKDSIRRRGENVSSFEVEAEINRHDAVLECAVIAVPSDGVEDEIKAVVVLKQGQALEPEQLISYLADRLPYFMVPRYVETLTELPKTPTQKIQKALLREAAFTPATWDREAAGVRIAVDR